MNSASKSPSVKINKINGTGNIRAKNRALRMRCQGFTYQFYGLESHYVPISVLPTSLYGGTKQRYLRPIPN